jgi:hypothetical protein
MVIKITNRQRGISIRATGKDAQALFDAMVANAEANVARKQAANASNPVPNRPKEKIEGDGAAQCHDGLQGAL